MKWVEEGRGEGWGEGGGRNAGMKGRQVCFDECCCWPGVRMCQKLVATRALQSVGAEATDPPYPPCAKHTFDSDQYWGCVARHNALTIYHATGTCKMGPVSENTTVVDPQLR